eukprot:6504088-Prymnesium_polylepis.1
MLMNDFKELYGQYRIKYDLGRALRWSEASYRTPFNERGLFVRREDSVRIDGTEHRNVDVIIGLGPQCERVPTTTSFLCWFLLTQTETNKAPLALRADNMEQT